MRAWLWSSMVPSPMALIIDGFPHEHDGERVRMVTLYSLVSEGKVLEAVLHITYHGG